MTLESSAHPPTTSTRFSAGPISQRRLEDLSDDEKHVLARAHPAGVAGFLALLAAVALSGAVLFLSLRFRWDSLGLPVALIAAFAAPFLTAIPLERRRFTSTGRSLGLSSDEIRRARKNLLRGPMKVADGARDADGKWLIALLTVDEPPER